MRKIFIIFFALILCFITGCNKETNKTMKKENEMTTTKKKGLVSLEEVLKESTPGQLKCDSYSLGKYMKNFWDTQIIYNETCMFFEDEDGTIKDKTLLYPIAKILEVRDNTLGILYEEGKDYTVVDGKLHYLNGSRMSLTKYNSYYLDSPNNKNAVFESISKKNKYLVYSEGDYFTKMQVSVTYIRTEEWAGPEVKRDTNKLPKTMEKLKNKEKLTIVYYGDSMMEGCNASSFNNVEPQMPTLSKLITKKLKNYFEYDDIIEINTAVGGWTTNNGVADSEFKTRVLDKNPDLVVICFGANDATHKMDPTTFGNNLFNMMKKVLKANPNCEFILMSEPKANIDAKGSIGVMRGNIEDLLPIYEQLSEDDNVAYCDVASVVDYIYTKKDFIDITANNINHPNDFMIRVIAQMVCSTFID